MGLLVRPLLAILPFKNQLQADFADQGLTVLAINLDEETSDAQSFLAGHPTHFKIADGTNQACATSFHVEAMPSSYLIDRTGKVGYIDHGFRTGDAGALRAMATSLVGEPIATPCVSNRPQIRLELACQDQSIFIPWLVY